MSSNPMAPMVTTDNKESTVESPNPKSQVFRQGGNIMYYDAYSPWNRSYSRPRRRQSTDPHETLLAIALSVGLFVVLILANLACM